MYIEYRERTRGRAKELRTNMTLAERIVWYDILSKDQMMGYRFLRQKPIEGFIADFYCSKLRLVIEVDGDSHIEKQSYDIERTIVLKRAGLRVLRIKNNDVINDKEKVKTIIKKCVAEISTPLIKGAVK